MCCHDNHVFQVNFHLNLIIYLGRALPAGVLLITDSDISSLIMISSVTSSFIRKKKEFWETRGDSKQRNESTSEKGSN